MYRYIGPDEFLKLVDNSLVGKKITSESDIYKWLKESNQSIDKTKVTVTFIIDLQGFLRINDRHSEHVVCSGGEPVLSAGEMSFEYDKNQKLIISEISNQSTGFCPEPQSWVHVEKALKAINLSFPSNFTEIMIFRICKNCNNLNLIKDDYYVCLFCNEDIDY